jgi:pyrroloquinoline quinone biosynthesis protein D
MSENAAPNSAPSFSRGVRLRREEDGSTMLLVPEGIVRLNASAGAALALVDGRRTLHDIAAELAQHSFDVSAETIESDVNALFERLRQRNFVRW